jgi:catechol 2,3-dioxygenase-like lactoylglutathione lyase family enzyme
VSRWRLCRSCVLAEYAENEAEVIEPTAQIRIARPSRDLAAAERFYIDGLGLRVLYRALGAIEPGEHELLMVGWSEASWHLELTRDPETPLEPSPTVDDLLVIYLDGDVPDTLAERLLGAGGRRVMAHNAYWERWGVTVEDPDGYRLVLCTRAWSNAER